MLATRSILFVAAIGSFGAVRAVDATPLFSVSAQTDAVANGILGFGSCPTLVVNNASSSGSAPVTIDNVSALVDCTSDAASVLAFGDVAGVAAGSALRVNISASIVGEDYFDPPCRDFAFNCVTYGSASGSVTASETDNFTITGSGTFEVFYSLSATLLASYCETSLASLDATVSFGSQFSVDQFGISACPAGGGSLSYFDVRRVPLQLSAGDTLSLSATLSGIAATGGNSFIPQTSASVLAGNSLHFFLTPITPGAAYVTSSGLDYTRREQVPEPGTLGLVATGFTVTAVRRARKRLRDSSSA